MAAPGVSEESSREQSVIIPDKTLEDGIHAVFSPCNNLLIHRFTNEPICTQKQVEFRDKNFLHVLSKNCSLYNSFTRKLINECHGIFQFAVRLPQDVDQFTMSQNIKKISQRYHSVLLACMEELVEFTAVSDEEKDELDALNELFTEIELIWSLIEVMLFDNHSRSLDLYRLLDWIKWHFTEPAKLSVEISDSDEPYMHVAYWDTILQFLFQGNIDSARSLLKAHPSSSREDFLSLDELLRKMPVYVMDSPMSWNEFQMRWRHWQEECQRRHLEGDFEAEEGLDLVARILCGDVEALNEKSGLCETWYHFLVSYLLYTEPTASLNHLGSKARMFAGIINSEKGLSELDNIILSAMELDIMTLIRTCCTYFNDGWWFVAHMTDLLYRGGCVNSSVISHSERLRESLILNYAESLMTHDSLWELGLDYLDQCEEFGREYTEFYLEKIPLDTEIKAKKVLRYAKEFDLEHLEKAVCKIMTLRAIKSEMFGSALSWVIMSKDVRFATDLANRWIKEYSETGKFHCFDILKNLGFCMLVSDKLTFLGKYCEFHKLNQEKEYKAAASLLVSLLSSNLVPKQFQMVLLLDALPLLEAPEPIFTMMETNELMACLEGLSDSSKENRQPEMKPKERLIRLALARNIARSFMAENSYITNSV